MEINGSKEIIDYVTKKLESVKREAQDMQNYINIANYAGKQWIAYDSISKKLYEPPKEPHKVRLVANKIQPIVRTELSKITKNKPIVVCVPASSDEEDESSAKVAEKFLEYLEYSLNLAEKDKEVILWGLTTTMGWVKPFWNPNKGSKIVDPTTGKTIRTGDVDIDVVSEFEIKKDPTAKCFSELQWICHEKVRSVDYVKSVYNKEVKSEDGLVATSIYESQLKNLSFNNSGYKPVENSVIVKEFWEKPSIKYPKGRRITIAGGEILFYEESIALAEDDDDITLPFFPFVHIKIPGRVEGMSIIEQLIPIQKEYNKTRSQLIEYKNLMTYPQWVSEKGSLIHEPTDEPGQVIEYLPGTQRPSIQPIPPISSDVYKNLEFCNEEFFFISGQQEVSHGGAPAGVKSGVAIRFLQEQDDSKIAPTISNWIECKKGYMTYLLRLAKANYDIPKTIKIVGKNKKIEIISFTGSQITSTDIRIEEGSMFQQSKAAKQQYVFDLLASGVLNPQSDRQLVLKMLELGVIDELYDSNTIDTDQAHSEEIMWVAGKLDTITRDFFNHEVHILEHNKFRKSKVYDELDPQVKSIIDQHVLEHEQYINPPQPNMTDIISQLSPEEQEEVQRNPAILDNYMKMRGNNNAT